MKPIYLAKTSPEQCISAHLWVWRCVRALSVRRLTNILHERLQIRSAHSGRCARLRLFKLWEMNLVGPADVDSSFTLDWVYLSRQVVHWSGSLRWIARVSMWHGGYHDKTTFIRRAEDNDRMLSNCALAGISVSNTTPLIKRGTYRPSRAQLKVLRLCDHYNSWVYIRGGHIFCWAYWPERRTGFLGLYLAPWRPKRLVWSRLGFSWCASVIIRFISCNINILLWAFGWYLQPSLLESYKIQETAEMPSIQGIPRTELLTLPPWSVGQWEIHGYHTA